MLFALALFPGCVEVFEEETPQDRTFNMRNYTCGRISGDVIPVLKTVALADLTDRYLSEDESGRRKAVYAPVAGKVFVNSEGMVLVQGLQSFDSGGRRFGQAGAAWRSSVLDTTLVCIEEGVWTVNDADAAGTYAWTVRIARATDASYTLSYTGYERQDGYEAVLSGPDLYGSVRDGDYQAWGYGPVDGNTLSGTVRARFCSGGAEVFTFTLTLPLQE